MVYPSKKDPWLVGLVGAAVLGPFLFGVGVLVTGGTHREAAWSMIFISLFTAALVAVLTVPLDYEITASALKIRCGVLIRQQIPLDAITEVCPTRNPLSAPAWSLDRLQVSYRRDGAEGFTLISPDDQDGFLRELASRAAGLAYQGGRLVRETVHAAGSRETG